MKKLLILLCLLGTMSCHSKKVIVDTEVKTKTEESIKQAETKDSVATNMTNEKSRTSTENNNVILEGVKFDSMGLIRYADKVTYNRLKVQEDKEKQSITDMKVTTKDTLSIQRKELKKEEKETVEKEKPGSQYWKLWVLVAGLLALTTLIFYIKSKL